ncbi:MAG: hypothetical protein ACOYVD_02225 [Bacillota bacterium]
MGINVIAWLTLIVFSGILFYQMFGLDDAFDPMLAEHVDFDMKKPENGDHHH